MPHSMCDMPQHRPGLLAQCVMHRDESCDDEAHYIEAHDARNEAQALFCSCETARGERAGGHKRQRWHGDGGV